MHFGSGNRGCEAIVRTTSAILNGPDDMILWTFAKHEDIASGADKKFEKLVASEEIKRFSLSYFIALWGRRVLHNKDANLTEFLRKLFKKNIAISIGGDNYCYPWSARQNAELNRKIRRYCKATVLWGCSVEPNAITPEIREDLAAYDLITVRESLTYELLKKINPNVTLVSDPAFLLEKEEGELPDCFLEGNTVGVNVSPLIMQYGTDGGMILDNYRNMIRYILEKTDMNICLIPHVMWENNNDLEPIQILYNEFLPSGRVCRVSSGNALQLKGYIARCRFFVGARTHATIAAYSSCVPTIAVGYSIKSRGIAKDLFGTEEHYVLSVQGLNGKNNLRDEFEWLMENEQSIRKHLKDVMPQYAEKAKIPASLDLFRK